jgi:hypothetical protein
MTSPVTMKHREQAAATVASAIHGVEMNLNELTVKVGGLFGAIGEARMDLRARMGLQIGMEAAERVALLATTVAAAYRQSVSVHEALSGDKADLGLTTAIGDIYPTFTTAETEIEERGEKASPLRIVA